jgi:hypothetical protein
MSRFNSFLHHTGDRLALPKATRSLILVEIASDLEDLFQHYLQQGLSEDEAAARAEEKVDMSDEALAELVRIHADTRGWTDRMSRRSHPLLERIAMDVIVIFFFASAALMVFETNIRLLDHLTALIWPILGIFVALMAFLVVQLTRSPDHSSPTRMRESLATPLFLGAASVVVGLAGSGISMYRGLVRMAADPEHAAPVFARTFLSSTATFAIALLVTLAAGVVWFVLAGRVARSEDDAERSYLGVK